MVILVTLKIVFFFLLKIIFATPESTEYRVTTSKDVSPKFVTIREKLGIFVDAPCLENKLCLFKNNDHEKE